MERLVVPTVAVFAAAVLFSPAAFAVEKSRPIAIKSFSAPCEVRRASTPGKWFRAKVGMGLNAGDTLRTGPGGSALLLMSDGSRMSLRPSTRLQVQEVAPNRLFGLDTGQVKSFIKKLRGNNKFEIKTPLAAASVRGTVFDLAYDEKSKEGFLDVDEGLVALAKDGKEVFVGEGQRVGFNLSDPLAPPATQGSDAGGDRESLRREVGLGMSKEDVMAAAAGEIRLAEYQEGKVMTDVFGKRVRLEQYIIRRPQEIAAIDRDKAFKLVVLNEREDRFDYFYYRGVANAALPADLSVAFKELNGVLGASAPTYHLVSKEVGMSNTVDSVKDVSSGGHLVEVTFDGTDYTLSDPTDALNVKTVSLDQGTVVQDGVTYQKVYDPVGDRILILTQEQFQAGDYGTALFDDAQDAYRMLGTGDTYWRTGFNDYSHAVNGAVKQSFTAALNTLQVDTDASWSFVGGGSVVAVTDSPSGDDAMHDRARLFYSDGTQETYNTYLVDDQGEIAPESAFAGLTAGASFKNELLRWNYQQVVEATEFQGRKIDLVVSPKILVESGLIK